MDNSGRALARDLHVAVGRGDCPDDVGFTSSIIFFRSAKMSEAGTAGRVTPALCGTESSRVARANSSGSASDTPTSFPWLLVNMVTGRSTREGVAD
jgi:hypothetical protein